MFEINVEFTLPMISKESTGFGIYFLRDMPVFPDIFGKSIGMRHDYNGVAVFLYKS